jgi:putative transposase
VAKKRFPEPIEQRRRLIDQPHPKLSIRRQCELLGLNRLTFYYRPASESEENLHLMRLLDRQYTRTPF